MKVYKLEFRYCDAVEWGYYSVQITAISKLQLIKSFIKECKYIHHLYTKLSKKQLIKDAWNTYKKDIVEEDFTFPIIKRW